MSSLLLHVCVRVCVQLQLARKGVGQVCQAACSGQGTMARGGLPSTNVGPASQLCT